MQQSQRDKPLVFWLLVRPAAPCTNLAWIVSVLRVFVSIAVHVVALNDRDLHRHGDFSVCTYSVCFGVFSADAGLCLESESL